MRRTDPTRRAILADLTTGTKTVTELAEPFDVTLPAISRHLKVLEKAGLIERSRDAQYRSRFELADSDGRTELTLSATYPTAADLQKVLDMGMVHGITETLDRLDEHLGRLVADAGD